MDINTKYDPKEFPEECFCHIDESISYNPDVFTEFEVKDFQNIKYIREDLVPKWHKYPDEKPSDEEWVMVTLEDHPENAIGEAYLKIEEKGEYWIDWREDDITDIVIAWMPFPKPYKSNKERIW